MTERADVGERLDVRVIPPSLKHSTIFGKWKELRPGESFTLINDHDPRPLHHHFNAQHPGQFEWEYLQDGPQTWRVRIGRPRS